VVSLPVVGDSSNVWGSMLNAFLLTLANPDGTPILQSGMQYVGAGQFPGNKITPAICLTAQANGYTGLFLDPRVVWDFTGFSIDGATNLLSNFTIESRMGWSIGWTGNLSFNANGCIKTDIGSTPADGIQIYAVNPTLQKVQGLVFKNCVFVGANTNAVVHCGGGARDIRFWECLFVNTAASATAYGFLGDTALSDNNCEDYTFYRCGSASTNGGIPIGIGIHDQTQHWNDTDWYGLVTSTTGICSIDNTGGSNHNFYNFYDRSSGAFPSTATINARGGTMMFWGGEELNSAALAISVSGGGVVVFMNRTISLGAANVASVTNGNLIARGRCRWSGTINVTGGSANLDLSDPAGSFSALTITGGAGAQLMLAVDYNPGSGPGTGGFSGSILFQQSVSIVASNRQSGQTATVTNTWTPPATNTRFRLSLLIRVTAAGTSTIPSLSFTQFGGAAFSNVLSVIKQDGTGTFTNTGGILSTGTYVGTYYFDTDASGTNVVVTITPTGSTFTYSLVIEKIG
jgi:hypothetical protein